MWAWPEDSYASGNLRPLKACWSVNVWQNCRRPQRGVPYNFVQFDSGFFLFGCRGQFRTVSAMSEEKELSYGDSIKKASALLTRFPLIPVRGVPLMSHIAENFDSVWAFQPDPSDLLIATYPKAGTDNSFTVMGCSPLQLYLHFSYICHSF